MLKMKFLHSDICTLLHVQVFVGVNPYLLVSKFTRSGKQQLIQFYYNTLFVFTAELSVNVLYQAHPLQGGTAQHRPLRPFGNSIWAEGGSNRPACLNPINFLLTGLEHWVHWSHSQYKRGVVYNLCCGSFCELNERSLVTEKQWVQWPVAVVTVTNGLLFTTHSNWFYIQLWQSSHCFF